MKTKFSKQTEDCKSYYLKEYQFFNGEYDVIFNILEVNFGKNEITLAVTNQGRISVNTYDLVESKSGRLFYFEYGVMNALIFLDDFRHIQEAI